MGSSCESERVNIKGRTAEVDNKARDATCFSKVFSYLLEVSLSLNILLAGTLASVVVFSTSSVLPHNIALAACFLLSSTILWMVVGRTSKDRTFSTISYMSLLNTTTSWLSLSYYPTLHFLFFLSGLAMSLLRNLPLVPLLTIASVAMSGAVFFCLAQVYADRLHRLRAVINCLTVGAAMILAVLSNQLYWKLGIGLAVSVTLVILLALSLAVLLIRMDCCAN